MRARRRPFDVPVAVHALSALMGAWIAYDSEAAGLKLVLVWGGVAVYGGLSRMPSYASWRGREVPLLRLVIGLTPALVSGYFLLTNDWSQPTAKAAWLEPVRQWLAPWQLGLHLPRLHPNLVGGLLAMWLPLQAAALGPRSSRRGPAAISHLARSPSSALVAVSCAGLLMSSLRGAWLALAMSMGVWWWWRLSERLSRGRGWLIPGIMWTIGLLLAVWLAVVSAWGPALMAVRPDRLLIWRNSWALAWDYFFTGLGLGNFAMPYSSYALLVHVPHTTHAHNLLLDLWLEQGLVGMLAFVWLVLVGFRPPPTAGPTRWRTAALLALLVIVFHGLVDDVYYGYGGRGALVLLVPLALLARRGEDRSSGWPSPAPRARLVSFGVAAVLLVLVGSLPATRALAWANRGALGQTRVELSTYRWPQWPVQDAVRRAREVDLFEPVRHYRAALAVDPGCASANRRLGQIALSLGAYDEARRLLATAYRLAPTQPATQLMFGESLALTGDIVWAADIWRTMSLEQDQLAIRQYWYGTTDDARRAQWLSEAIALAQEPGGRPRAAGGRHQ